MDLRFTLTDYLLNKTEVEEPVGWDSLGKTIQRDREWHGIFFQFTQTQLEFIGDAYFLIKDEKKRMGVDGDMGLLIEWNCPDCEECEDNFRTLFDGKLDFEQYDETCGDSCSVKIGVNNSTAETLLKNRQDTNVDLTSNIAYDGVTTLTDYAGLGMDIEIPSKAIRIKSLAQNVSSITSPDLTNDPEWPALDELIANILPAFTKIVYTDIADTSFRSDFGLLQNRATGTVNLDLPASGLFPLIDAQQIADAIGCLSSDATINYRYKGSVNYINSGGSLDSFHLCLIRLASGLDEGNASNYETIAFHILPTASGSVFDIAESKSLPINAGDRVWFFLSIDVFTPELFSSFTITEDVECFIDVSFTSLCDPTPAKQSLFHEAASRVVESITNNQYKFKSDYYGRTDSEPYAAAADGCGGLRSITNGLNLRRAKLQDGSDPNVFTNFKDLFQSCNALDAVGIGIEEADPVLDDSSVMGHVRFEPLPYFYSEEVIFVCDGINTIKRKLLPERIWNQFKFGFDKFETESTNGLDAIHTKRQYRTPIINSSNPFEKICKYIFDGYAIEATRRKFGTTEDWRYDQNIFGLCLYRDEGFHVEQGNITGAANLFDPPTVINYRVSPIRNAMRWFRWVMQGVKAVQQIIFNSGEGNYVAEGQLTGLKCTIEGEVIAENETIDVSKFQFPEDATPFMEPELVTYNFPLGANEFLQLLKNKYGLIAFRQDADDAFEYGWIDSIKYTPEDGTPEFNLILQGEPVISNQAGDCDGVAPEITMIERNINGSITITGTATASTTIRIYGSVDPGGPYIQIGGSFSSAGLLSGITIPLSELDSYEWIKVRSTTADCDYGYSSAVEISVYVPNYVWVEDTSECEADETTGFNTGNVVVLTLKEIDQNTGIATGNTKANDIGDPDYIAPYSDTTRCPVPGENFHWIGEEETACCEQECEQNTGWKLYFWLIEVDDATGLPTGNRKVNSPCDPDYIPPIADCETCPLEGQDITIESYIFAGTPGADNEANGIEIFARIFNADTVTLNDEHGHSLAMTEDPDFGNLYRVYVSPTDTFVRSDACYIRCTNEISTVDIPVDVSTAKSPFVHTGGTGNTVEFDISEDILGITGAIGDSSFNLHGTIAFDPGAYTVGSYTADFDGGSITSGSGYWIIVTPHVMFSGVDIYPTVGVAYPY